MSIIISSIKPRPVCSLSPLVFLCCTCHATMPSKNDVFSASWAVTSPSSSRPSAPPIPLARYVPELQLDTGDTSAMQPSSSIQLRCSSKQLGNGRHATVHLSSYRSSDHDSWKLCAAKRLSGDKESQIAGLNEAIMLSRLSKCLEVLQIVGLKDERDDRFMDHCHPLSGARTPSDSRSTPSSPVNTPPGNTSASFFEDHIQQSSLRRAATVKHTRTPSRLNQLQIFPGEDPPRPASPRLILLTEYCQLGNLATFVKEHGTAHLGQKLFFEFACQLLQAVCFAHELNIIHADVKPQNCMVRFRQRWLKLFILIIYAD